MKLKPCPFCGGQAGCFAVPSGSHLYSYAATVRCIECHQSALGISQKSADNKASEAWNRRTPTIGATTDTEKKRGKRC